MTINIDNHTDAFTHHVYQSIDANVRATFTPRQVHAIETAIRANKPFQKHPVDLRGVVPLFFIRLYFVVLIGRDRRKPIREKEAQRRLHAKCGSALLSVYMMVCMITPIIFVALYLAKSAIGIDIIEGVHLNDLMPFEE